jgi:hypothetical protein
VDVSWYYDEYRRRRSFASISKDHEEEEKEIDSRTAAASPMSAPKARYSDRSQPCVHKTPDAAAEAEVQLKSGSPHCSAPFLLSSSASSVGKKLVWINDTFFPPCPSPKLKVRKDLVTNSGLSGVVRKLVRQSPIRTCPAVWPRLGHFGADHLLFRRS